MKIQHSFPLYYSLILLFLATTTTLISPSHGALGKCNPSDYKALMNIKKSLNNPYHLASWVPNTDCCEWYVVKCDRNTNRINELTVFQGEISGQIPSSHLTNVTGTIPRSITKLKRLIMLDLTHLSLSGPVPNFLNQLTTLTYLDLSFNQFTGSIPPNLSELKNLGAINLSRNRLTGSIPESFGILSLGSLDYGRIHLSRNRFAGDASVFFNAKHGLTSYIDLSRNQIEFDLSKVEFPKSLTWLDLSHNKIFGRIPEEIKGLELHMLNVSYNRLCGKIPYGGKMQSFDNTDYFHNKCLCGPPMAGCK
ncbi:hypothetical protein MKW92_006431 [Papaver armeniacum]|nr:hypothetical protein MKW92_006431 [Papaver armeniacum]